MNALHYTFDTIIKTRIPLMILELAFPDKFRQNLTIEERMMRACVRPIILTDMNLLSGVLTYIPVSECTVIATDTSTYSFIIEVPKILTGNRSIINVMSLVMGEGMGTNYMNVPLCASPIMGSTSQLYASQAPSNVVATTRLELVGENKVLVEAYPPHVYNGILKCNIENNTNLENVQPGYYPIVANVITLGLKAYIYNNLRPQLDVAHIYAGHELAYVKEFVDGCADAYELYREELKTWAKMSVLNDSRKASQFLSQWIGMLT